MQLTKLGLLQLVVPLGVGVLGKPAATARERNAYGERDESTVRDKSLQECVRERVSLRERERVSERESEN